MKHLLGIAFLVALFCSCATQKQLPKVVTTQDSIRQEVRIERIERIDTVFIELPTQITEVVTNDTTSTLENDYARSTATILPNGMLFHNLLTKDTQIPVSVVTKTEYRDSIIVENKETPVYCPVEVEVNRLTWFQQAQIYGCRALIALLLIIGVIKYRGSLLKIIRHFV